MLDKYFNQDEVEKLVMFGPENAVREIFKHKAGCSCKDCEKLQENVVKHLEHPFYADAQKYREKERIGQIVKGAEKYPTPFDPAEWTAKELLQHAMQENIDQGHYIYGLFEKIEAMESRAVALASALEAANAQAEYWRLKAVAANKRAEGLQGTLTEWSVKGD